MAQGQEALLPKILIGIFLIVLDKAAIERSDYDRVSYPFFEKGLSIGELFSPVLYTKEEWRSHADTLFGYNVNSEGIKVL